MTRLLVALFIASTFAFSLPARIHESTNGIAHGIGIGGVVFNTWGFNYRRYFDKTWGMTVNLGGWVSNNNGRVGLAAGATYTLAHHAFSASKLPNSSIRIYGVGYVSGIYGQQGIPGNKSHFFDLGLGIGPGAEYFFNRHFSIHAELPWMTFFRLGTNSGFASSHPHFGGGVSYYF